MQERRDSNALAMELRLSCTNPSEFISIDEKPVLANCANRVTNRIYMNACQLSSVRSILLLVRSSAILMKWALNVDLFMFMSQTLCYKLKDRRIQDTYRIIWGESHYKNIPCSVSHNQWMIFIAIKSTQRHKMLFTTLIITAQQGSLLWCIPRIGTLGCTMKH